jgi:hypothetical protein
MTPEICPNCGAEVPADAKACPECGSDEQTGWSEKATSDRLDLPDDDFDYEQYIKKEFAPPSPVPQGISWFWWLVALALLGTILFFWIL